ncbi:MAG: GGDEF domain-containing protein [Gaiellales bacterium]
MAGVVQGSAWDLAVESVDEALREGAAPSLARLGRLGQLGTLPSFLAALGDDDPKKLVEELARDRESLGLAPREVAAELVILGRVLERHGESAARRALDDCLLDYFGHVTAELAERARRDPLTGLLSHRAFHARLADEAARARRYRGRLALVAFDLDRFKELNDREGHAEGDRHLRAFAAALATTLRETDTAGRLGGDEFAALLLEADGETVQAFLERLADRIAGEIVVSAGIACLPGDGIAPEQLLAAADGRLYAEKALRAA